MDDLRGEDQNGFFSIVLRHFHSTLCEYDFSGKESVFNNLDAFFLSLNEKRNCKKYPKYSDLNPFSKSDIYSGSNE